MMRELGATGRFPEGKLRSDDDGELQFGIAHQGGHVIVNFGVPVTWLGLPPRKARELASLLVHHAEQAEKGK
jgi:hypothetical protein